MKFYSEITKQLYDTAEAADAAEKKVKEAQERKAVEEQKKREARASRAKEVEEAIKIANEAQAKAIKLLKEFTKDYGYFHTSYSVKDDDEDDFMSLFSSLF